MIRTVSDLIAIAISRNGRGGEDQMAVHQILLAAQELLKIEIKARNEENRREAEKQ